MIFAGIPTAVQPGGHILQHNGIGADNRIIADFHRTGNAGAGINHDIIADFRIRRFVSLSRRAGVFCADGNILVKCAAPPDRGKAGDNNPGQMRKFCAARQQIVKIPDIALNAAFFVSSTR